MDYGKRCMQAAKIKFRMAILKDFVYPPFSFNSDFFLMYLLLVLIRFYWLKNIDLPWHFPCVCLQWHIFGTGASSHSLCQLCRQWTLPRWLQIHLRKLCHFPHEYWQEHNTLTSQLKVISSGTLKEMKEREVTSVLFVLFYFSSISLSLSFRG